jgi:ABC-type sulfate transport system substrate-binding protein
MQVGLPPAQHCADRQCGTSLARTDLTTIADFGGWKIAQARYFDEVGMFDQIYASK